MMRGKRQDFRCSFCGRDKSDALVLVAGLDAHICEVCVEQAQEIVAEELYGGMPPEEQNDNSTEPKPAGYEFKLPKTIIPSQIKEHLDKYVIGQEEAKKTLSVAVYNH